MIRVGSTPPHYIPVLLTRRNDRGARSLGGIDGIILNIAGSHLVGEAFTGSSQEISKIKGPRGHETTVNYLIIQGGMAFDIELDIKVNIFIFILRQFGNFSSYASLPCVYPYPCPSSAPSRLQQPLAAKIAMREVI